MTTRLQRRTVLGGAIAGAALLQGRAFAQSGPNPTVIPWSDQPPPVPPPLENVVKGQTPWESLNSWITPNDKLFSIGHYNRPAIDTKTWRLDVAGMVAKPATLALDELKSLPRHEVTSTLECSGNNGLPFATSTIQVHRQFRAQHVDRRCDEPGKPVVLRDEWLVIAGRQRFPAASGRTGLVRRCQRQMAAPHRGARYALPRTLHGSRLCHDTRGAGTVTRPSWRKRP